MLQRLLLALFILLSVPLTYGASLPQEPQWGLYIFGGASAGRTKIAELTYKPWAGEYADNYLVGTALSLRLVRNGACVFDGEVGVGYRFPLDAPEAWAAVYVRYENFPWNKYVFTTVGIDTGLSYITTVPGVEKARSTSHGNVNGARILHYLGPEVSFALPSDHYKELVWRIHHRSGAMGTFNGVWSGSNVMTLGFRYRF